jgi:hypothetical protein
MRTDLPQSRIAAVILLVAPAIALAAPPDPGPPVRYQPLVLSGEEAPGFAGRTFTAFPYHSVVNDASYTVFLGSTLPGIYGSHSPEGLFVNRAGGTSLVAKVGEPAPGMADGVTILSFDINYHRPNAVGQVVFESTLDGPGIDSTGDDNTNAFANWIFSPSTGLTKIAQFRDPAAGVPGAIYRTFSRTTVNDLGHVAFSGDLVGAGVSFGNATAFWYGPPGDLQLLARQGDPIPGQPGVRYGPLSGFDYPVLSPGGKVAFSARVTGQGLSPAGDGAVVVGTPGNLQVAFLPGFDAPGTQTKFRDTSGFTTVDVNDTGEVSFAANFEDGTRGLYVGKPGSLQLIARTGEPAPGMPGQTMDFFFGADLNGRGEVAFNADVQPTDDHVPAVYLHKPGRPLELIAAGGLHAPGTEDGVVFGNWMSDPVLNRDGQVAFFASLTGPGSRGEEDYGIFATGHSGDLRLIGRVGDSFELAPGDTRTIAALSYAGIFGGHILTFNEDSDLSFLIKFTDGSQGLFTATVLPEPATLLGLALLSVGFLSRRRDHDASTSRPSPS